MTLIPCFEHVFGHAYNKSESVYVIDINGYDLWKGIVQSIDDIHINVYFPESREAETFSKDTNRILPETDLNVFFYAEQEAKRKAHSKWLEDQCAGFWFESLPDSIRFVDPKLLGILCDKVGARKISLANICAHFRIHHAKFKEYLSEIEVPYPKTKRSKMPKMEILCEMENLVSCYVRAFRTGYKRCNEALSLRGHSLTETYVRGLYEKNNLFKFRRTKIKETHSNFFVAKYAHQLWRTDLKEINFLIPESGETVPAHVIAFIDDRTRFIVHAEILGDKKSKSAASALENALRMNHRPFMIASDNGGEFTGKKFTDVLARHNIVPYYSKPHTPQHNGKMERWWQVLDSKPMTPAILKIIVHEYNNFWPHRGIHCDIGIKMTPSQAMNHFPHWVGHTDLTIEYL